MEGRMYDIFTAETAKAVSVAYGIVSWLALGFRLIAEI